ncbi:uncharacterized protein LOC100166066 isoform X2 [Acyrthosiphon pisum]|uniref:GBD/FH3 domain-containing protein n=1 Tax=Acyrthosiphon pisum TaxID=7029 RepID=A0A8R2A3I9_ACYPI|nr:uncharacterized protein LOC100166066 isoform X2 [Acyrthosiphon pisum]|eukprot:XP_001946564.2 PREDICTED: uncharacterized protein LOC100166066 [Acyrthosiphon pisum]
MVRKPKDANMISAKPNSKMNDHVARLRVVQEVSSRNSSASWNSSCTFSTEQSFQDQPRPPVYNVEDYAGSLRKFGKRGPASDVNNGDSSESKETEMTLKEFTSATELLEKLNSDLKLAYFSFVQEFVGDPIDGVTLLLELLKTIQQNGTQTKCTPANQRRIALDENACLQCLKYCMRCQDAARKLAISPAGLYTLAACIMSTVNQSRLLTLELLTKACCESGTVDGHNTVSDAMSTMRLRFAEPVRFRFLVGMMSGSGSSGMELLLAGLKFINAFTETCPDLQTKFYVQAELKQAGFKPAAILKNISNKSPLLSSVSDEIYRWQKNFINVESLKRQHDEVIREAKSLREKVTMLEKKIHILQEEKRVISSRKDHVDSSQKNKIEGGGNSAEDEGISSSEQDDCEEEVSAKKVKVPYKMYSVSQGDTTIEEVLEDFDKVINDASTESGDGRKMSSVSSDNSKRYYEYSDTDDVVIIPTRIVPEPPRRSRSLFMNKNFEVNPFFEDDEESIDSECAYEDDDDEVKSKIKRSETFHSVQKQIKRFSDLALNSHRVEDEEKIKDGGRRKSIYNVFGNASEAENSMYANNRPVTRSVSTRNVNDSRIPVIKFDHCKSERSVYLPMGCRVTKEPKVFMTRGHNNAGLYSGYKDTTAAAGKDSSPKCKLSTGGSSNGLKALQHINMSVSTGKLSDFPSGLY